MATPGKDGLFRGTPPPPQISAIVNGGAEASTIGRGPNFASVTRSPRVVPRSFDSGRLVSGRALHAFSPPGSRPVAKIQRSLSSPNYSTVNLPRNVQRTQVLRGSVGLRTASPKNTSKSLECKGEIFSPELHLEDLGEFVRYPQRPISPVADCYAPQDVVNVTPSRNVQPSPAPSISSCSSRGQQDVRFLKEQVKSLQDERRLLGHQIKRIRDLFEVELHFTQAQLLAFADQIQHQAAATLPESEAEISVLREENSLLQTQLRNLRTKYIDESSRLKNQMEELREQNITLQRQLEIVPKANTKPPEIQNSCRLLVAQVDNLRHEATSMKIDVSKIYSEYCEQIAHLFRVMSTVCAENAALQRQNTFAEGTRKECADLRSELCVLTEQNLQLHKDLEALRGMWHQTSLENEDLSQRLASQPLPEACPKRTVQDRGVDPLETDLKSKKAVPEVFTHRLSTILHSLVGLQRSGEDRLGKLQQEFAVRPLRIPQASGETNSRLEQLWTELRHCNEDRLMTEMNAAVSLSDLVIQLSQLGNDMASATRSTPKSAGNPTLTALRQRVTLLEHENDALARRLGESISEDYPLRAVWLSTIRRLQSDNRFLEDETARLQSQLQRQSSSPRSDRATPVTIPDECPHCSRLRAHLAELISHQYNSGRGGKAPCLVCTRIQVRAAELISETTDTFDGNPKCEQCLVQFQRVVKLSKLLRRCVSDPAEGRDTLISV
eukprot:TRINITY_DN8652_c0_g1_i2.p1 TRINITY_DN8652_c0_g1~~TRINITY_DN8652_c0_g1_i2.p1  ORF type:complete len:724 (-),score=77.40 TRINITY_DN8652_c0_g1_i2:93-2264(-)